MSNQKKKVQINAKEDLKQEEKLIAVMLLETYSEQFRPFSLKKAECLLPLIGGKTQLDCNIEYLIRNKMEEIYLFCTTHHSQIRAHLTEERLKKWRLEGCEVHFLYNFKCQSVGDAMREIDSKGLVRSNFVLITAPTIISNINLSEYLETHKSVSKIDKNSIMTMLCQDITNDLAYNSSLNETSFGSQSNTVIIHNNTNRLMHYDQVKLNNPTDNKRTKKYINLPVELFQNAYRTSKGVQVPTVNDIIDQRNESDIGVQSNDGTTMNSIKHLQTIQQRNELIESGIYLCSPYVLHMFTDNFDYESMPDYIKGVLIEEEVAGYTCYVDVIKKKFNMHYSIINNVNAYYFEMMRILQRIELVLNEKERTFYRRLSDKINVNIHSNQVKLGTNTQFEKNCLIEANCTFGNNCSLINCYIGSNCIIADKVKLSNCIIWSNTQIGKNSTLNAAWLGHNVKIGNNCNIFENTLISNDCHVKDNTKLSERGVYSLRRDTQQNKGENIKTQSENNDKFTVLETTYVKYYLNDKSIEEAEDSDDDFGSIDGDEEEFDENESSAASENEEANDTSKNNHFYVWKTKTRKLDVQNRLRRNSEDSVSSNDSHQTDLSAESTDEYEQETEEEDNYDDYDNDNELISKAEGLKITDEDHNTFLNETIEILKRGIKNNLNPDNMILEINSCKHANNIQIDDLCYFLTKSILKLPIVLNNKDNQTDMKQLDYLPMFKTYVKKSLGVLLTNYFTKTKQSQKIFLDSTLDFFVEIKQVESLSSLEVVYVKLLHYLYNDIDLLSETIINNWYEEKSKYLIDSNNKEGQIVIKKLEPFIDWINESEEESDEDDDE